MIPSILVRKTNAVLRLSVTVAVHSKLAPRTAIKNPAIAVKNTFPKRFYSSFSTISTQTTDDLTVDYDYVKTATSNDSILIIDVREPDEIKEHGKIPNSINIPLGEVSSVLSTMPDKEFEQTFKRPKPAEDTPIIFYCMIGKRSGMAQQNALNVGFKNVKNYLGSWTDWATKSQS